MGVSFSREVREIAGCRVALERGGEASKLLCVNQRASAATPFRHPSEPSAAAADQGAGEREMSRYVSS